MQALDEQAAGIVVEIVLPVVELAVAEQDLVAIAFLEKDGTARGGGSLRRAARHRGWRRSREGGRSGGGGRNGGEGGRNSGGGRRSGGASPSALWFSAGSGGVLKRPPSAGTAALKAAYYVSEMLPFGQRGFHADDEVKVVGHKAKLPYFNHRIILGNLLQLCIADCQSQSGKLHPGASSVPHNCPNKGSRPLTTSVSI